MKRIICVLSFIAILASCKEKTKTKEYTFPELAWTISVPTDFIAMDSAQIAAQNKKGADAIEKTFDTTISYNETKTLISVKKGLLNNFIATITPYDPKVDGNWTEANEALKQVLYQTFDAQMTGTKIDTSSSVELISGMEFQVFKTILTYPNKMVLQSIMYSKLYKGYDFGITITYNDEKAGEQLKKILHSSKFAK